MKTIMTGLLKGRITRWGFLAALVVGIGALVGWSNQQQFRLGGAWVGSSNVGSWNVLQIPLDPAGKTEALRVHLLSYGADTAGLLAASGADTVSDLVGQGEMVSTDTAKWKIVGYAQAQGATLEVRQIWVAEGTLLFTGRDSFNLAYTLTVYPAEADVDGNGLPDAGATPLVTIPGIMGSATRVHP